MKKNLKKSLIIILVIIILVAVILFFVLRDNTEVANTNEVENIVVANAINEINPLVVETSEAQVDQAWVWQHDTLENHNINAS